MGMYDIKVREFDDFFIKNYKYLLGFTRSIDVKNNYHDLLHDCFIKCRTRIDLSGYSGNTYLNFVRVTLMNTYKTNYRDTKHTVDFDNEDFENEIEDILQLKEDFEQQKKQYDYDMVYLNTMAYDYVDRYFTAKESMIFRTYYVLKHKHINYKMLAEATNYSQTSVSNTVKKIKKELRLNLKCYINTGLNVMELQDKIKMVEGVLQKPFNKNLGIYKQAYIDIFGKPFRTACNCQLGKLHQALLLWYNNNKQFLNK